MVKAFTLTTLILSSLLALAGCTSGTDSGPPAKELRIFTWSDYFDDETLRAFERQSGAKVRTDYFSSNEQLLAKLQLSMGSGEPGYDLILPSDYMARIMMDAGLLLPLDKSKLPFLSDFAPEALHPDYDKDLKYTVPLAIGLTGVAINTNVFPEFKGDKELTWKDFFENPKYAGKISLLDDTKEVLAAALFVKGKKLATATEQDVKDVFAYLKAHKKQVRAFTTETRPVIEGDECALCMVYSGDALTVTRNKPEIRFVLPQEGASIWTDSFGIPKNAANPDLAHQFIATILSAEGAKRFTESTGYRTANLKAKALLPKEISSHPIVYPQVDSRRFSYLVERKDLALLIDKEWTELRSQ
jgi:spermidine/putrescine transport system substrate-binding protein